MDATKKGIGQVAEMQHYVVRRRGANRRRYDSGCDAPPAQTPPTTVDEAIPAAPGPGAL